MDTVRLLEKLVLSDEDDITLLKKEDTGLDIDMLDMVITSFGDAANTGEGEFFFLGEERPEFFVSRITVTTGVLNENIVPVCVETAVNNYDIPLGSFAYDPEAAAVLYLLKVPIIEGLSDEEIIEQANVSIRLALNFSRGYAAKFAYLAHRREA